MKKFLTFEKHPIFETVESYGTTIACPYCKDPHGFHHRRIDAYFRKNDRDKHGPYVSIDYEKGLSKYDRFSSMDENPSGKRDGISIWFWCETGCPDSKLNIKQHQGTTYFEWGEPSQNWEDDFKDPLV